MWTLLDEYIPLKKKGGEKVKTPMNFITLHSKEYMDYIRSIVTHLFTFSLDSELPVTFSSRLKVDHARTHKLG